MGTIRGVRVFRRVTANSPFYLDLISVKNPVAYVTARIASPGPPPTFLRLLSLPFVRFAIGRFRGYHFIVDAIELDVESEVLR